MLQECQRCGTCCRKGPPALHEEDVGLYEAGWLGKGDLMTLRRGEWVYDSVMDALVALPEEIVRIAPDPGGQSCSFLAEDNTCRIYEHRPRECRAMKCWAPSEFEAMYKQGRIDRSALIPGSSALGEIIAEHERSCAYAQVRSLAERVLHADDRAAAAELGAVIQEDEAMRAMIRERTEADEAVLRFLFGRPLKQTLPAFGLRVESQEDGFRFYKEGNARLRRLV